MPHHETQVAQHYTTGALTERVLQALRESGVDPAKATAEDLKAGDEFHTGGIAASEHFFGHFEVRATDRVLDVGSGIGGTTRLIADRFGAAVTGVDLTPEFVETARELTEMVGLGHRAEFHVGSALDMPVPDSAFDLAVMMHVGMNIADKPALMAEVARSLKPGGTFAVFDVMQGANRDDPDFPLPWSTVAETSFLHPPEDYAAAAEGAGLALRAEHDRTDFAMAFFEKVFAKLAEDGAPALGIHLMMGDTAPLKFQNYVAGLKSERLRPVEMIFEKPS